MEVVMANNISNAALESPVKLSMVGYLLIYALITIISSDAMYYDAPSGERRAKHWGTRTSEDETLLPPWLAALSTAIVVYVLGTLTMPLQP